MRKKIFHNWGLKLASLILAFMLWLLVIEIDNPKDNRVFVGVPVTLVNTELLDAQDKFYQVLDNTDTVRVTVRGPRTIVDQLSYADIVAEADISKLTEINTIAISFSVQNVDVEVVGGNPDVLRLNVEDKADKWINVQYGTTGEVAEGYIVSNVQLNQNRIEVSGPKSAVDQIDKANVELDVSGAVANVSANVEILLYDAEGNLLELPNVTKSVNSVLMQAEVLATREVPIEINVMGVPADGFLATGVTMASPATVMLAGTASALENARIVIPEEELNIAGANGDVRTTVNIREYLPENTKLADSSFNGRVDITVYVEPEAERTFEISADSIAILHVPEGLEARKHDEAEGAPDTYELRVSGLEALISSLPAAAPSGVIDIAAWMEGEGLEDLSPGVYDIPVTFRLPEGVVSDRQIVLRITFVEVEE